MEESIFPSRSDGRYKVMLQCWRELPGDRPSFPQLVRDVGDLLEDEVRQVGASANKVLSASL